MQDYRYYSPLSTHIFYWSNDGDVVSDGAGDVAEAVGAEMRVAKVPYLRSCRRPGAQVRSILFGDTMVPNIE